MRDEDVIDSFFPLRALNVGKLNFSVRPKMFKTFFFPPNFHSKIEVHQTHFFALLCVKSLNFPPNFHIIEISEIFSSVRKTGGERDRPHRIKILFSLQ